MAKKKKWNSQTIKEIDRSVSKNNKAKRKHININAFCRDCGEESIISRLEFNRAATPKCTKCGGLLDTETKVRYSKRIYKQIKNK